MNTGSYFYPFSSINYMPQILHSYRRWIPISSLPTTTWQRLNCLGRYQPFSFSKQLRDPFTVTNKSVEFSGEIIYEKPLNLIKEKKSTIPAFSIESTCSNAIVGVKADQVSNKIIKSSLPIKKRYRNYSLSENENKKEHSVPDNKLLVDCNSCNMCKKTFNDQKKLESHLKRDKIKNSRRYQCLLCKKSFVQKSALDNHKKTHLKVKPHLCKFCDKRFADPSTLTKHLRTHTKEKPYYCPNCHRGFSQSGNMLRHKRKVCQSV